MHSIQRPLLRSQRADAERRALALGVTAVASATAFVTLAAAVADRQTAHADRKLSPKLKAKGRHPLRRVASAIAPFGKWWAYVPASLALSAFVLESRYPSTRTRWLHPHRRQERIVGAGAIVFAGMLSAVLAPIFDEWLPQPPVPPGRRRKKSVFPSGHAFGPTAVSATSAYVLAREGLVRPELAGTVAALIPLISAGGKLIEEKHWASDVLGGALAAAAVSTAALATYELGRSR
jgi:membrane-associated phospholipid phosphatase